MTLNVYYLSQKTMCVIPLLIITCDISEAMYLQSPCSLLAFSYFAVYGTFVTVVFRAVVRATR